MNKFGIVDETLVKLYRVLNDEGEGFYQKGFDTNFPRPSEWWGDERMQKDRQPQVVEDIKYQGLNIRFLKFAFSSIDEMERWFPLEILKKIEFFGGQIIEIDVPKRHVFHLNNQVAYYPSREKKIRNISYK